MVMFWWHSAWAPGGLFWLDGGDFATAGFELGVPHATGFPLYVLLAKLAALLPLGSVAWRINLLSALAMAGAAWLWVRLWVGISQRDVWSDWPAMAVGLLVLGLAPGFQLWARTADVYALHGLLVMAMSLLVAASRRGAGRSVVLAFVVGLGLSNHAEIRLFSLALLGLGVISRLSRRGRTGGEGARFTWVMACGVALVLGLLPYLLLPLSAAGGAYHVWDSPIHGRFWAHVTGQSISQAFPGEFLSLSWPRLVHHGAVLAGQIWEDFGPLLLLTGVGAVEVWRRKRWLGVWLLLVVAIDVGYAVVVNPMGLRDRQNGVATDLVLVLLVALGAGSMMAWMLSARVPRARARVIGRWALAAMGVAAAFVWGRERVWSGWGQGAEDLAFEALQPAPSAALVLTSSEALAAGRLYWVGVGGLRPDLQVLNRHELSDSVLLARRSREGPFPLAPEGELAESDAMGLGTTDAVYRARIELLVEQALGAGHRVWWEGGSASDSQAFWARIALGYPLHEILIGPISRIPGVETIPGQPWEQSPVDPWEASWMAQWWGWTGTYYYQPTGRAGTSELPQGVGS
jgi:hypothetical protein